MADRRGLMMGKDFLYMSYTLLSAEFERRMIWKKKLKKRNWRK